MKTDANTVMVLLSFHKLRWKTKTPFKRVHPRGFETWDLKFELYFLFTKSVQCTEGWDRLSLWRTGIWRADRTVCDWSATCCCPCVCGRALLRGSFSTVWSIFHIFEADLRLDQLFLSSPLLLLLPLLLFGVLGLPAVRSATPASGRRCAQSCPDHDEGLQTIPNCVWECECDWRDKRRCLESSTDTLSLTLIVDRWKCLSQLRWCFNWSWRIT